MIDPPPAAIIGRVRPEGSVAAIRFEIQVRVRGRPVIAIEHTIRLREDLRPERSQPTRPGGPRAGSRHTEPAIRTGFADGYAPIPVGASGHRAAEELTSAALAVPGILANRTASTTLSSPNSDPISTSERTRTGHNRGQIVVAHRKSSLQSN